MAVGMAAAAVSDPLPSAAAPAGGRLLPSPGGEAGEGAAPVLTSPLLPAFPPLSLPPFPLLLPFLPRRSSSRRRRGHT